MPTAVFFDGNNKDFNMKPKEMEGSRSESEIKRLASLKKQKQAFKTKGKIIRDALNAVDSNRKNKITFKDDDDGDVRIQQSQNESSTKFSLFNNDDNNDEGDEMNLNGDYFDVDSEPKYKTFGGDERFRMERRFLKNDDENRKTETNETVENGNEFSNEKKMQLEILESVLGKPVTELEERTTPGKRKNQMIRYDPNSANHRNFEIEKKPEASVVKKKKKKDHEMVVEEPVPIPVSDEIFYSVSDKITESLNTQEEFSLLKTFGAEVPVDTRNEHYETQEIQKKSTRTNFMHNDKTPFIYDSSDDDDENANVGKDSIKKSNDNLTTENIPLRGCDSFFFTPNDLRFRDIEEFLGNKSDPSETFQNVRCELKQIVRSKIRNNARKNQPFKKKIGGAKFKVK